MPDRHAIHELAARHRLAAPQVQALEQMAGLHQEPSAASPLLQRGVSLAAAGLLGLALLFWIAANWDLLGRWGQFALLQSVVALSALGGAWHRPSRPAWLLAALLAQGGVLAYFGQTYQTGADPWQLFAWWTLLALPLSLAARSDVLWTPWALVALVGVALWTHDHQGRRWNLDEARPLVHLAACLMAVAASAFLASRTPWHRLTGTGIWSFRASALLAGALITAIGLDALFAAQIEPGYLLSLLVLVAAAWALVRLQPLDLFVLSVLGLALDTLLFAGLAHLLFDGPNSHFLGQLFILGVAAAALVGATVTAILKLTRAAQTRPHPDVRP